MVFSSLRGVQKYAHEPFNLSVVTSSVHSFSWSPKTCNLFPALHPLTHSGRGICLQGQSQSHHLCPSSQPAPSQFTVHIASNSPPPAPSPQVLKILSLIIITLSLSSSILSFLGGKKCALSVPTFLSLIHSLT